MEKVWMLAAVVALGTGLFLVLRHDGGGPGGSNKDTEAVVMPPFEGPREAQTERATRASSDASLEFSLRLNQILTDKDPLQRPIQFGIALRQWLEEDPEGALAYVRQMPRGNEFIEGLTMVLDREQQTNPERALKLANELVTTHEEMHLYNMLFERIAGRSISGALEALEQAPAGEPRGNAIRAITSVWAASDITLALNWAGNLSAREERDPGLESVLILQAAREPRNAILTAQQYLEGPALERVRNAALEAYSEQDDAAALEILAETPASQISNLVGVSLVHKLAAESPGQAATWINTLPRGEEAQAARMSLLDVWSRTALAETEKWDPLESTCRHASLSIL